MANDDGWRNRLRVAGALAAAGALLSWPALWNGYPLVWPDTGGYIHPVQLVFRSVFYNFLIAPLTWAAGSLWPVVFFQSLVVAYVLRLILRDVFGDASPRTLLAVTLGLAVLTSLPWVTGLVMADAYAPVVVLALFLLAFCAGTLTRWERLLMSVIVLEACLVHLTHPVLAAGLLALFAGYRWAGRKRSAWPVPRLGMPAIPVVLAVVLLVGNNVIAHHQARYSVGGYAFTLGRLIADGPAIDYLREACPVRRYALCDFLDELPRSLNGFLWSDDSPFRKLGGFKGYQKEGREIVDGTLRRFPGRVAQAAAINGIRQLSKMRTGGGLVSYRAERWPTDEIRRFFPRDFAAYENSRQSRGELGIRPIRRLHSVAFVAGLLACAGLLPLLARRGRTLAALLLLAILSGYVLNAFVTALSVPDDRYGARVAWMIPFFCLACAGSGTWKRSGGAGEPFRRAPDRRADFQHPVRAGSAAPDTRGR